MMNRLWLVHCVLYSASSFHQKSSDFTSKQLPLVNVDSQVLRYLESRCKIACNNTSQGIA